MNDDELKQTFDLNATLLLNDAPERNRTFMLHTTSTIEKPDERSPNGGSSNDGNSSIWKSFPLRKSFVMSSWIDFNY